MSSAEQSFGDTLVKVAVVGSRDGVPASFVDYWVDVLYQELGPRLGILTGGARGVDRAASAAALRLGVRQRTIRPDYNGAAAPKLAPKYRNWEIARECDRMLAIWDGYSTGTAHAIAAAVRECKPVKVVMLGDS